MNENKATEEKWGNFLGDIELTLYLKETLIERGENIFERWKTNIIRFSLLLSKARKYISCPAKSDHLNEFLALLII